MRKDSAVLVKIILAACPLGSVTNIAFYIESAFEEEVFFFFDQFALFYHQAKITYFLK